VRKKPSFELPDLSYQAPMAPGAQRLLRQRCKWCEFGADTTPEVAQPIEARNGSVAMSTRVVQLVTGSPTGPYTVDTVQLVTVPAANRTDEHAKREGRVPADADLLPVDLNPSAVSESAIVDWLLAALTCSNFSDFKGQPPVKPGNLKNGYARKINPIGQIKC
jgi:hypothetical protein